MKMQFTSNCLAATLALLALAVGPSLHAQNVTWSGTGTDFNTGANWSSGSVPASTNNATFTGTAVTNPNLSANVTNQAVFFSSNSSGYTLSADAGRALSLNQATAISAANTSGTNTISANIVLTKSALITIAQGVGGTLVLSGNLSATQNISLSRIGSGTATFTLAGANTFGSTVTIQNAGTVVNINNASALGTSTLALGGSASLNNTSGAAITLANNNSINLNNNNNLTFLGNSAASSLSIGTGTVTITGGRSITTTAGGTLTIGRLAASVATDGLEHKGAGTLVIQNAAAASYGGTTILNANTTTLIGSSTSFGTGNLTMSGTLKASTDVDLANAWVVGAGGSVASFSGSSNITFSGAYLGANTTATKNINNVLDAGKVLTISGPVGISNGNVDLQTLTISGNGTTAISGNITNNAAGGTSTTNFLTNNSTGVTTLSGTNTYTGNTTVNAGTLIINGTNSGTGLVSVASGATLGGNGTIGGATTIAGILAPGNSLGQLNITANTTWSGAAIAGATTDWKFELDAGDTADLLNITGDFLKNTTAGTVFEFNFMGSIATGTFKLVDWTGTTDFNSGDFTWNNLGGGNTVSGFNVDNTNGALFVTVAVPEPATWALLAFSLTTVMVLRRRRV